MYKQFTIKIEDEFIIRLKVWSKTKWQAYLYTKSPGNFDDKVLFQKYSCWMDEADALFVVKMLLADQLKTNIEVVENKVTGRATIGRTTKDQYNNTYMTDLGWVWINPTNYVFKHNQLTAIIHNGNINYTVDVDYGNIFAKLLDRFGWYKEIQ